MVIRVIPLAICLAWLAYEARFSPSFFVATVDTSLVSIAGGIEATLGLDTPLSARTALVDVDGS